MRTFQQCYIIMQLFLAKSAPLTSHSSHEEESTSQTRQPIHFEVDAIEAINLLEHHAAGQDNPNINPLEALLGGGVGFPPIIDIPPDADDETMVELAIALSLQVKLYIKKLYV